jgi:hypothetical protein
MSDKINIFFKTFKMAHIKVVNISPYTESLKIHVKDAFNNDVLLDIPSGHFAYSESDMETNTLIIYKKKRLIHVTTENKPNGFDFYVIYHPGFVPVIPVEKTPDDEISKDEIPQELTEEVSEHLVPMEINLPKEIQDILINSITAPTEPNSNEVVPEDTILDDFSDYSKLLDIIPPGEGQKKKKSKHKKRVGRPKKRGPKKGSKRDKGKTGNTEEPIV